MTQAEPEAILELRDLSVRHGAVLAVDGLSLKVPRGKIV